MFYVGQKVICVRHPAKIKAFFGEAYPHVGGVFTIREIFEARGGECLRLFEISNPPYPYVEGYMECGFRTNFFRPVVERKTDISIFKALLNPKTAETV